MHIIKLMHLGQYVFNTSTWQYIFCIMYYDVETLISTSLILYSGQLSLNYKCNATENYRERVYVLRPVYTGDFCSDFAACKLSPRNRQ